MQKRVIVLTTVFIMTFLCACGSSGTINEQALTDLIPGGIAESKEEQTVEDTDQKDEVVTKEGSETDSYRSCQQGYYPLLCHRRILSAESFLYRRPLRTDI